MCEKAGIPGLSFRKDRGPPSQLLRPESYSSTATKPGYHLEQETLERTDHRSIEKVRRYKRQSEEMLHDTYFQII